MLRSATSWLVVDVPRVLVTGASSLLGRAVVAGLVQRGDEVTCFQRRPSASLGVDVLGDIRDADALHAAARGQAAIIHLAALVAPRPRWRDAYDINVGGTCNVLDTARDCGRLVYISTPSVAFHDLPSMGSAAEAACYGGLDAYARSKAMAEVEVLSRRDLASVILRPHLVWGPGDTQLVGRIVSRARQGRLVLPDHGRALLDTTYIDDAAAAILAGLDRSGDAPAVWGRPLVVTGNDPRPLAELVTGILRAAGISRSPRSLPAPLVDRIGRVVGRWWPTDEPPLTQFAARQLSVAHWFDQRDTQAALRWTPVVSVDEGIGRLTTWFHEQGSSAPRLR